jgi:hypothetical protein
MPKLSISLLVAGLLLVGIFGLIQVARGQGEVLPDGSEVIQREFDGDNTRELLAPAGAAGIEAPDISFIDSQTPYCYQPASTQDECLINWSSLYVDAGASTYMITMTATINAIGPVAHYQGFFQQTMYITSQMHGQGFQVACGSLGAGGNPKLGNTYAWTIRARASDGLKSANYGTIYCPAFTP